MHDIPVIKTCQEINTVQISTTSPSECVNYCLTIIFNQSDVKIQIFSIRIFLQETVFVQTLMSYDDVIKWNHFPRYWSFVQGIHPVIGEFPAKKTSDAEL